MITDIAKMDRAQLRFLSKQQDKENMIRLADRGIDLTQSLVRNPIFAMAAGVLITAYANRKGWMDDMTAGLLGAAIVGGGLFGALGNIGLGDAIASALKTGGQAATASTALVPLLSS